MIRSVAHPVALAAALLFGAALSPSKAAAQLVPAFPNPPITFDRKGVTVYGADSVTRLTFRFRVQQLLSATSEGETDFGIGETEFVVRRMRLRMEGTLRDPRLTASVQLSFARADLDQENTGIANVLRDANVTWQFTPSFAASVGQGKLPSNRQRLVSSSELQSPDRSLVNGIFTADRDVGVFAAWSRDVTRARVIARAAVTSGEGRNPRSGGDGLAYTGRLEVLPFGAFSNGGDYFEGDLAREPRARLSLAVAASRNDRGMRTGGQLGPRLFAPRSASTYFADLMFKRKGVMVAAEYAHRHANDPLTMQGDSVRFVYGGEGHNVQVSWLLPGSTWEPQLRYTSVLPARAIRGLRDTEATVETAVGLARYVNAHRIKFNGDLTHARYRDLARDARRGEWRLRLGAEVGI